MEKFLICGYMGLFLICCCMGLFISCSIEVDNPNNYWKILEISGADNTCIYRIKECSFSGSVINIYSTDNIGMPGDTIKLKFELKN